MGMIQQSVVHRWSLVVVVAFGFMGAGPAVTVAAGQPFTLISAVPGDVFMVGARRTNPERDFIDRYWDQVWSAARESGIADDVMALISGFLGADQAQEVERLKKMATELIAGIDLKTIASRESLFAQRMVPPTLNGHDVSMGPPDMVWLFRGSAGAAKDNAQGLMAVQRTLAQEINKAAGHEVLKLAPVSQGGLQGQSLRLVELPEMGLAVAFHGDVTIIAFGDGMLKDVAALLSDAKSDRSLAHNKRFRAAFASLPGAEDELSFFDLQAFLRPFRALADHFVSTGMIGGGDSAGPNGGADASQSIKVLIARLFDSVGIVDYTAEVGYTDGYSTYVDKRVTLVADAAERPIYKVIKSQGLLDRYDRYVPENASSFSVSGAIDFGAFYSFLVDTIRLLGPDGQEVLDQWAALQTKGGFDIERDLFSWLEGQTVSVSLPSGMGSDNVFMVKVRDEAVAREKLNEVLTGVSELIQNLATQQPMLAMMAVRTSPCTDERLPGFTNVGVGMSPTPMVVGVSDGYIMFGTSAAALASCRATASGEAPSIKKNARVMKEAVLPKGKFSGMSFNDERSFGSDLAGVFAGASMAGGMAMMAIPDPEAQKIVQKVLPIVGKIGPIVSKVDFYNSTGSYTSFDGKAWTTRSVTNYREPE